MDKYSSSVNMILASNSFATFDIFLNMSLNNYSRIMIYLSILPLLTKEEQKPLAVILVVMAVVFFLAALGIVIYLIISKKKEKQASGSTWLLALGNKENVKEVKKETIKKDKIDIRNI